MAEGRACVERLLHRDACGGPPKRRPRGSGLWFQLHHSVAVNFFVVSPVQGLVLFCWVFFRPHPVACGILGPQSWIKPMPPAMRVQSLNHWTTKEVPSVNLR